MDITAKTLRGRECFIEIELLCPRRILALMDTNHLMMKDDVSAKSEKRNKTKAGVQS